MGHRSLALALPRGRRCRLRSAGASRISTRARPSSLLIGFCVGGGYDLYARHLARYIGKHIPGNPTIVPQNMAGRRQPARRRTFSIPPRRRTAPVSAPSRAPPASLRCWRAARRSTAPSSPGSAASPTTSALCVTWHTSPVKTWNDFLAKPVTLGGQGAELGARHLRAALQERVRRQIKLVAGYPGTNEITLAMERGEVDGLCGLSWSTIKTPPSRIGSRTRRSTSSCRPAFKKEPELGRRAAGDRADQGPGEAADPQADPRGQEMARPFAAPPGIPADRKAALIAAFDAP